MHTYTLLILSIYDILTVERVVFGQNVSECLDGFVSIVASTACLVAHRVPVVLAAVSPCGAEPETRVRSQTVVFLKTRIKSSVRGLEQYTICRDNVCTR